MTALRILIVAGAAGIRSTLAEIISTGSDDCWRSFARNVRASKRGVSMSRMIASGASSRRRRAATRGSGTVPITSRSGSAATISASVPRMPAVPATIRMRRAFIGRSRA